MKITLKLNIGNYQSIDFTTNELDQKDFTDDVKRFLYIEIINFLRDWEDITENATKLKNHLEEVLKR